MLTRRTTYGIRALARMVRASGRAVSVAQLADRDGIPLHFLSLILSELRQHGIVRAQRGRDGGYELAIDPTLLSIAQVVECLGGPLFPFPCLSGSGRCRECRGSATCAAERALGRASRAARDELLGTTLADVASSLQLDDRAATAPARAGSRRPRRSSLPIAPDVEEAPRRTSRSTDRTPPRR
jgi:Rrf2 family protein